jgi:hypothetical protein
MASLIRFLNVYRLGWPKIATLEVLVAYVIEAKIQPALETDIVAHIIVKGTMKSLVATRCRR